MWSKRADTVVHGTRPYNAEPTRGALAAGHLTATDTFYSRNHGPVPDVDPASWRLRVDGLVESPLGLSLADLRELFEPREVAATLQCAGNRRAGLLEVAAIPDQAPWGSCATSTATWTGVALADVLRAAGVEETGETHVAFEAPDVAADVTPAQGYGSSVPLRKALSPEVLLAWGMNGTDLPAVHGAPVRVVVPGWIGARSVKWVERVTVQHRPSTSHFQDIAYRLLPAGVAPGPGVGIPLGPVALNSDVLVPDVGTVLDAGPTEVRGYAFAGDDREVVRVDVSLDGGRTWEQADLDVEGGPWTWTLWRCRLDLPAGPARITVRAWDTTAATQPESPAQVWNPLGYVNNAWGHVDVTVR